MPPEDINTDTYERELVLTDIYRKLAEAEKQIADGDLLDADKALAMLRQKYGR